MEPDLGSLPLAAGQKAGTSARQLGRVWAYRALLGLGSAAFAVGLGEAYCRVNPTPTIFNRLHRVPLRGIRRDRELGHANLPGYWSELNSPPLFKTRVRINSRGLRDREFAYSRTPGRQRCLVLGDSFVFGWGVE